MNDLTNQENSSDELELTYEVVETELEKTNEVFEVSEGKEPIKIVNELSKGKIPLSYTYSGHASLRSASDYIYERLNDKGEDTISHAATIVDASNFLFPVQEDGTSYQEEYVLDDSIRLRNKISARKEGKVDIELKNQVKNFTQSQTISGRSAVLAITAAAGDKAVLTVPLPNSGIRVVLRSPTLEEFVAFEEQLGLKKGQLGRSTLGFIFTHLDVLMTEELYLFIFEYIEHCNLENWKVDGVVNVELLKQVIKLTSLFSLVDGLLATYYPEGHNLIQPCTNLEGECLHVEKGIVNFNNIWWCDESKLNDSQLSHMTTSSKHTHSLQTVLEYQNHFKFPHSEFIFDLNNGSKFKFEFEVPTLEKHTMGGERWVRGIESIINSRLSSSGNEAAKRRATDEMIDRNQLKPYASWIKSIVLIKDGVEIKVANYEDNLLLIEQYSDNEDFIGGVVSAIWKFMNYSNVVVIGVPSKPCPSCGHADKKTIVPVNIIETFFTLLLPSMSKRANLI